MDITVWIIIGIAVALSAGPITNGGSRRIDEKQLAKLQWKVGLPLPAELREPVLGRIAVHERWRIGGGLVGVALAAIGGRFLPAESEGVATMAIFAGGAFGAGAFAVLAVFRGLRPSPSDAPRVARGVATELADYLPAGERRSARLAPFLAVLAGLANMVLLLFLPREAWLKGWMLAAVVVTVLTLVGSIVATWVSRRVLEQGQRAASDLELAWDDLIRAQALRGLWGSVIALGAIAIGTSFVMVGTAVDRTPAREGALDLTLILGMVAAVVALVLLLVLLIPLFRGGSGVADIRHVLTRLWPDAPFVNCPWLRNGDAADPSRGA